MLSLKFTVTLATSPWIEIESILFSVGYKLPYNRPGVIFSLSQVQNYLGDERDYRPLRTPQTLGGTSPFWQPPDILF
jgi:hypothetical protein